MKFLVAVLGWGSALWLLGQFPQLCFATTPDAPLPKKVEFNRDIRPLLSDNCFACHGPDQNQRKADLRLDTEHGLIGSDAQEGVVIPHNPSESELMRRILSTDPDELMPPREFGKELSARDRELISRWIEQGATWQGHWSFQPVTRPSPTTPGTSPSAMSQTNFIDHWIQQARDREGLVAAPRADPKVLVRRLSFDLLGLPPSPELVAQYAANPSSRAYEQMVDDMLASPQFGERMAMWWLDLVRYADSVGYHGDQPVKVAPFRDYVIRSFNNNKPFDQFTKEQIAGDLLPDASREALIASGYNRLGMMSAEGGVQPKEYLAKYIAERVRSVSGAWLGITLGCCECHDHKYDPFTARDFYQMQAFFADVEERGLYDPNNKTQPWGPQIQVPSPDQQQQRLDLEASIAKVRTVLDTPTDSLKAAQEKWEDAQVPWTVLEFDEVSSEQGVTLKRLDDGSYLASGKNPDVDTYTLATKIPLASISALRIEVLPDDSLPKKGPGRAGNGNFVLSELEVFQLPSDEVNEWQRLCLQNASATYEQVGAAQGNPYGKWSVAAAIDQDEKGAKWGWAVMEQAGQSNSAVFEFAPGEAPEPANRMKVVLKQNLDNPKHTLGRFRISVTEAARPIRADQATPPEIAKLLSIAMKDRTPDQIERIAVYYRSIAPELKATRDQLREQTGQLEKLDAEIPTTLVTKSTTPRTVKILKRGNWMDESGETVDPAIPSLFAQQASQETKKETRLNRLDLANWIVDEQNPLTARVTVNRLWKLFYGSGLSRKLDDLGAQGEWPSHPELLDALAVAFIDSRWDLKYIIKQMVMSETYQQSSSVDVATAEKDPYNRWLSHQSRWRLDAEMVRDNALSISGLLVDELGGPSVNPYQPKGYWAYLNFPQREWKNGQGSELYRRGVYTHWQRQYLHPALLAFDAPSREECTAERSRSNTPLQALVLLNDPTYVEAARAFGERILQCSAQDDAGRLEWAVREVLGREQRDEEKEILLQLLTKHRQSCEQDSKAVDDLLAVGERKPNPSLDRKELAAWTSVARTLLNLHETITRN